MFPMPTRISEIVDRCGVLRRQEEGIYKCHDYLSPHSQVTREKITPIPTITSCLHVDSSHYKDINKVWREEVCEWTYAVIDHFYFNREVAFISLNYLDRYLSAHAVNITYFKLAALTSLYIAVKLYEPVILSVSSFVNMSNGNFR